MQELEVVGVRIELPSNQPLVLLKEANTQRHLPIWIGAPEASAIAMFQQGIIPPRPLTHDLMISTLQALHAPLVRVEIVSVLNAVFTAELVFADDVRVDARSSDAIALALRAECPILCDDQVLDEASVMVSEDAEVAEGEEDQVREFREFLNEVEPEDFDK
ncbi:MULTISPECIES: bifunctional nuclease family protein [Paeniglutamicibacter]|jgi:bifunctional DNase/RNase|uniref:Bifunctional DNase/RNase n=1 Tax=Paeniglutamicibacter sulfureus TaxID=43666 RepID=A0ABU2BEQ5_9MICC|nr:MULTISPECIES: bifunctional nuclease family protein [Paeniglutamicibacter]MCV9995470.1 bifunctional nuclease family protein [Paeniglutamicibacter sp. ZC-3]MDO2932802.1 bifunctional nuclease family protein [Paeniglutamicibacter sulfureus]MDR7357075.1 bifunctional DNase/RNase [Paeniglutamicibacter sulfureus]